MAAPVIVNGRPVAVDARAATALLWVLRGDLGLCAAKFGCGVEQCGACRVLIDDVPAPSCRVPIGDLSGRNVSTLELLVKQPEGRLVVDALVARNAGQCGYCLPGIAVTLVHLVRRGVAMSRAELARALDEHLCRCGSQPRIFAAAADLLLGGCGAMLPYDDYSADS